MRTSATSSRLGAVLRLLVAVVVFAGAVWAYAAVGAPAHKDSTENPVATGSPSAGTPSGDAQDFPHLSTEESWGDLSTLDDHFARHGGDFGATTADEYATLASEFFFRSKAEGLPTLIDTDGTIRVYEPSTNTFGAFNADGTTKTFFKPSSPDYWDRQPGTPPASG